MIDYLNDLTCRMTQQYFSPKQLTRKFCFSIQERWSAVGFRAVKSARARVHDAGDGKDTQWNAEAHCQDGSDQEQRNAKNNEVCKWKWNVIQLRKVFMNETGIV